jgi:hypothetical protein
MSRVFHAGQKGGLPSWPANRLYIFAVFIITFDERKQNDEEGGEKAIMRQIQWLAGSIIVPLSEHYENRIIFTILFALQDSRYHLISPLYAGSSTCVAKGFAVESTASPLDALDLRHSRLSLN